MNKRQVTGCVDCLVRIRPNRFTKIHICEQCRIVRLRELWGELSGMARAFGWEKILNG